MVQAPLALACGSGLRERSCLYVGFSCAFFLELERLSLGISSCDQHMHNMQLIFPRLLRNCCNLLGAPVFFKGVFRGYSKHNCKEYFSRGIVLQVIQPLLHISIYNLGWSILGFLKAPCIFRAFGGGLPLTPHATAPRHFSRNPEPKARRIALPCIREGCRFLDFVGREYLFY